MSESNEDGRIEVHIYENGIEREDLTTGVDVEGIDESKVERSGPHKSPSGTNIVIETVYIPDEKKG